MTISRRAAPWHLWVVGVVALLWNGLWCFDYTMTQTQGDAWLANMDPTALQMDWFHGMPAWTDGAWAFHVWGGALGAVLLLVRRKWALPTFVASFLGWAAGAVYAFGMSNGIEAMGAYWPILIVKGGVCVFFIWYVWMVGKTGILR